MCLLKLRLHHLQDDPLRELFHQVMQSNLILGYASRLSRIKFHNIQHNRMLMIGLIISVVSDLTDSICFCLQKGAKNIFTLSLSLIRRDLQIRLHRRKSCKALHNRALLVLRP